MIAPAIGILRVDHGRGSTVALTVLIAVFATLFTPAVTWAQDPTGAIEGAVTDRTASAIRGARVVAVNHETGFTREAESGTDGFYRLLLLPVGQYGVTVRASGFATGVREPIEVNVSQSVRVNVQLELPTVSETVKVTGGAQLVETSSNALGRVVTGRELVDLPLNGRNFTQLGLLQTGVAPLTAGVATAGGSLRQGQAYAVNGMRPEQNTYLVDGVQNQNRMDGGYALKLPVEAIGEFRILTQTAPPDTAVPPAPPRASSRARGPTSCAARCTNSCATTRSMRAISFRLRSNRSISISLEPRLAGPSAATGYSSLATTRVSATSRA